MRVTALVIVDAFYRICVLNFCVTKFALLVVTIYSCSKLLDEDSVYLWFCFEFKRVSSRIVGSCALILYCNRLANVKF